jgi:hypothetical protein
LASPKNTVEDFDKTKNRLHRLKLYLVKYPVIRDGEDGAQRIVVKKESAQRLDLLLKERITRF